MLLANSSSQRSPEGISGQESRYERAAGESDYSGHQAGWPSRPGEQQYGWEPPRVVADSHRVDRSAQAKGREHDRQAGPAGEELGDTEGSRTHGTTAPMAGEKHQEEGRESKTGDVGQTAWNDGDGASEECRQTKPPLGRDTDEPPGGLDYAELCVTCDNRTDELRLLGNGVVPATAERAFRTLMRELDTTQASR